MKIYFRNYMNWAPGPNICSVLGCRRGTRKGAYFRLIDSLSVFEESLSKVLSYGEASA